MELNIINTFNSETELHIHYPNDKKYSTKDVIEYWPSFLNDNPELKIRDVVYFEEDSFYIIKPHYYKYWHPAIAELDLADVIDQILSASGGEQ